MTATPPEFRPFQVNNIKIRYSKNWQAWFCHSPRGMRQEAFNDKEDARKWAAGTLDFVTRKGAAKAS